MRNPRSKRKPIDQRVEYQRMVTVRNYIYSNRQQFQVNRFVDIEPLLQQFNIEKPELESLSGEEAVQKYKKWNNSITAWQNRFNRILAQRGLYMRRFGDVWKIKSEEETQNKVIGFENDSKAKHYRGVELQAGISRYKHRLNRQVSNSTIKRIVSNNTRSSYYK